LVAVVLLRQSLTWPHHDVDYVHLRHAVRMVEWMLPDPPTGQWDASRDPVVYELEGVHGGYRQAALRTLAVYQAEFGAGGIRRTLSKLDGPRHLAVTRKLNSIWRRLYGGEGRVSRAELDEVLPRVYGRNIQAVVLARWYESAGDARSAAAVRERMRSDDRARLDRGHVIGLVRAAIILVGAVALVAYLVYRMWRPLQPRAAPISRDGGRRLAIAMAVYLAAVEVFLWAGGRVVAWLDGGTAMQYGMGCVFLLAAAVVTFLLLKRLCRRAEISLSDLGLRRTNIGAAVLLGLAGFAVAKLLVWPAGRVDDQLAVLFRPATIGPRLSDLLPTSPFAFLYHLVYGCVLAPIIEETFHRGVMLRALWTRMGFLPAAAVGSLVFAIGHRDPYANMLGLWCDGMVLCVLAAETRSLIPGMVCHAAINAFIRVAAYLA
jgi:membrane protease YdiL (CAAX protease family)